ncbi:hypothetical protein RQP46_005433 [Phenoliferia psychrophenolica]
MEELEETVQFAATSVDICSSLLDEIPFEKNENVIEKLRGRVFASDEDIKKIRQAPPLTVAFTGQTASGKSTLINALSNRSILASGLGGSSCTAVPINVVSSGTGTKPYAIFQMVTLDTLRTMLHRWKDDIEADPNSQLAQSATQSLQAVWKDRFPAHSPITSEDIDIQPLLDTAIVVRAVSVKQKVEANSIEELSVKIERYTTVGVNSEEGVLWPLVLKATIYIDSDILNQVSFLDVPGLGDTNIAREKIAREAVSNADKNAETSDLRLQGQLDSLIVVVTNTDSISGRLEQEKDVKAILRELNDSSLDSLVLAMLSQRNQLEADDNSTECDLLTRQMERLCALSRNEIIKKYLQNAFVKASGSPADETPLPMIRAFTVSSSEFTAKRRKIFRTAEETGIPALVRTLSKLAKEKKEKAVMDVLGDLRDIYSELDLNLTMDAGNANLAQIFQTNFAHSVLRLEQDLEAIFEEAADELEKRMDEIVTASEQGVKAAQGEAQARIKTLHDEHHHINLNWTLLGPYRRTIEPNVIRIFSPIASTLQRPLPHTFIARATDRIKAMSQALTKTGSPCFDEHRRSDFQKIQKVAEKKTTRLIKKAWDDLNRRLQDRRKDLVLKFGSEEMEAWTIQSKLKDTYAKASKIHGPTSPHDRREQIENKVSALGSNLWLGFHALVKEHRDKVIEGARATLRGTAPDADDARESLAVAVKGALDSVFSSVWAPIYLDEGATAAVELRTTVKNTLKDIGLRLRELEERTQDSIKRETTSTSRGTAQKRKADSQGRSRKGKEREQQMGGDEDE